MLQPGPHLPMRIEDLHYCLKVILKENFNNFYMNAEFYPVLNSLPLKEALEI
jgi:hypothetical protein